MQDDSVYNAGTSDEGGAEKTPEETTSEEYEQVLSYCTSWDLFLA